jgi:hypothetical protein
VPVLGPHQHDIRTFDINNFLKWPLAPAIPGGLVTLDSCGLGEVFFDEI